MTVSRPTGSCLALLIGLGLLPLPACAAGPERVIRVRPPMDLHQALDEVAALRARDPERPITVELASGLHRLGRYARIGAEHGGTQGAPLVIRGAADGTTRVVGSVPVEAVALPDDLAARLPAKARGRVKAFRLPNEMSARPHIRPPRLLGPPPPPLTFEVFDAQGALHPARWPNDGFARVTAGPDATGTTIRLEGTKPEAWRGEADLWAEGYWSWGWLFETIPVAVPEPGSALVRLGVRPYEGIRAIARARIVHALAELDAPGEWWRDAKRNLLLVWPRDGAGAVEVSVADTLISLEKASHVRIESLRLERTRGDLLTVRGGGDVVVRNSALAWSGLRAAVFEDVKGGGLEACAIADTGFGAVRLVAGDRPSLTPGGLFLRDSRLTRYARLSRTQSPALELDGVGNRAVGNYFHDAIDHAVYLRGNDHLVADNEITRLLDGATDAGAIYAGRDWTARGSVIRGNFLHDIRTRPGLEVKGVYLDDMASGFTVEGNLFVRVDQPAFIGGGRDNVLSRNVFADSSPAIHVDARGLNWAAPSVADPESQIRAGLAAMPTGSALWRRRYPPLAVILAREPGSARDNRLTDNVFWWSEPFRYEPPARPGDQVVMGNVEALRRQPLPAASDPSAFAAPPVPAGRIHLDTTRMLRATLPTAPSPRR
ncbi:right-handed parallel beta-helix repeat-containing protein [Methylorubrum salsuginis]|uniref:Right handed beta helix region n=1 Tax=Methylorubrum salsuginis TaxID=414703 RepID=A0A1I4BR08_9HYPH|nr:right-handed parallel beta-helix repeat-containing protein [Methylorubrum salsuginis]SFK71248.1 Right handed beta helix region [Methylorubrum salsuginis]